MARGLSTLLAPVPAIVDTLNRAGFTGGIGTGANQLAPPNPLEPGGAFALDLSRPAGEVGFIYVPPPPPPGNPFLDALRVVGTLAGFGLSFGAGFKLIQQGMEESAAEDRLRALAPDITTTSLLPTGGSNMAFQDGDSGFSFDNFFGGVNQAFQGGLGQSLLGIGTQALSGFVQQQFAPQPMSQPVSFPSGPMAQPVMASVPALGRAASVIGRGFFNRFPNLATSLQALRNRGANVTRGTMYSALKRFGPEMLISGGILTAAAVSELAVAGPGRRRMNPGNVKALRKAHRRMKSFHKVCMDNDQLLKRRRK